MECLERTDVARKIVNAITRTRQAPGGMYHDPADVEAHAQQIVRWIPQPGFASEFLSRSIENGFIEVEQAAELLVDSIRIRANAFTGD